MELLKGRASHVSAAPVVSGSSNTGVSTSHVVTFSIADRAIRIKGDEPPVVNSGDEMVVVGETAAGGVVEPLCWVNVSRSVWHSEGGPTLPRIGAYIAFVLGALALGLSALMLLAATERGTALAAAAIGVLALGLYVAGRYLLKRANRSGTALRMMREASEKAARR